MMQYYVLSSQFISAFTLQFFSTFQLLYATVDLDMSESHAGLAISSVSFSFLLSSVLTYSIIKNDSSAISKLCILYFALRILSALLFFVCMVTETFKVHLFVSSRILHGISQTTVVLNLNIARSIPCEYEKKKITLRLGYALFLGVMLGTATSSLVATVYQHYLPEISMFILLLSSCFCLILSINFFRKYNTFEIQSEITSRVDDSLIQYTNIVVIALCLGYGYQSLDNLSVLFINVMFDKNISDTIYVIIPVTCMTILSMYITEMYSHNPKIIIKMCACFSILSITSIVLVKTFISYIISISSLSFIGTSLAIFVPTTLTTKLSISFFPISLQVGRILAPIVSAKLIQADYGYGSYVLHVILVSISVMLMPTLKDNSSHTLI